MYTSATWVKRGVLREKPLRYTQEDDKQHTSTHTHTSLSKKSSHQPYDLDRYDDEENSVFLNEIKNINDFKDEVDSEEDEATHILKTDSPIAYTQYDVDMSTMQLYIYDEENGSFYIHHDVIIPEAPLCCEYIDHPSNHKKLLAVGDISSTINFWDLEKVDELECEMSLCVSDVKRDVKRKKRRDISRDTYVCRDRDSEISQPDLGVHTPPKSRERGPNLGENEGAHTTKRGWKIDENGGVHTPKNGENGSVHTPQKASKKTPKLGANQSVQTPLQDTHTDTQNTHTHTHSGHTHTQTHTQITHTPSTICLHHSPHKLNILTSGHSNNTNLIWDLNTQQTVHTYRLHTDKVQSVKWHPVEEFVLLSTSIDQTAVLVDVRQPKGVKIGKLKSEPEHVIWYRHEPTNFLVSCEGGEICCFDIRQISNSTQKSKIWKLKAHTQAVTSISDCAIPNLLMSSSLDGEAKVWSMNQLNNKPKLIKHKNLQIGEILCCSNNTDIPTLFAFGGEEIALWDVSENKIIQQTFNL